MMDNYFGFFSRHPVLINFQKQLSKDLHEDAVPDASTAETTTAEDQQYAKKAMNKEASEGVIVSISEDVNIGSGRLFAPDIFDSMTFEPEDGVFVTTDKPILPAHESIHERISMVEAHTKHAGATSEGLQKIAEAQKKSEISLTDMLFYSGALEEGATRSTIKGVVEVGDFTGNLNNKGLISEDAIYSSNGKSAIGRRSDESQVNLSLVSSYGNEINISISIKDEFNVQVSEGARRSLDISFEASSKLTEEEAIALKEVLGSLDPLINSFNDTKSLNFSEIASFEKAISSTSDVFADVETGFNYSSIVSEKSVSLSMEDDSLQVDSSESNMAIYSQSEHYVMNHVKSAFGFQGNKGQDYFLSFFDA